MHHSEFDALILRYPANRGEEIREIPRESRGNNEVVMETRLSPPVGRSPSPRRFLRVGYSGLDKFV